MTLWGRRTKEPEEALEPTLNEFERHAIWANHARWAMDHIQHRLEMAGQLAVGAIGIQGVLITLVAGLFKNEGDQWTLRFLTFAMIGLVASAALVLFGAFPRAVSGINPDVYREGWVREMHSEWPSPDQQFAEELLQSVHESRSPLVTAETLLERRMKWIRLGLLASGLSLLFVALGTLWPVIGDIA
ncbi:hypothetical protein [Oerskovia paurometabola]|uniref:hypothetical protein n=1 Tax=Oerskovia paurometabola TaxID=162170 RepID=UPI0034418D9A